MSLLRASIAAALFLSLAGAAAAQPEPAAPPPSKTDREKLDDATRKAEDIATQPARDVGLQKTEIPPVLISAGQAPYSLDGLKSCKQLVAAIDDLNIALGPDFRGGDPPPEDKTEKLAEAGGKTVVNSLLPFRGLVREVSGAAAHQRAMNAAIDAGYARRGFLRGVHLKQGCKPAL
jgi:hypothetical protein